MRVFLRNYPLVKGIYPICCIYLNSKLLYVQPPLTFSSVRIAVCLKVLILGLKVFNIGHECRLDQSSVLISLVFLT